MSNQNNEQQPNENDNQVIGNIHQSFENFALICINEMQKMILAEDNSDSDEDSKVVKPFQGGFAHAAYGGAFSQTVPDRVGSAPATDLSVKYFGQESPQNKKMSQFSNHPGGQNYGQLYSQNAEAFSNDPQRRNSNMDYGVYKQDIRQDQYINMKNFQIPKSNETPNQFLGQQQQQQPISSQGLDQQQFINDTLGKQNQSDIYSTKEYYDYYNSLKPRDPRLPKPTYQQQQELEIFKQIKKQQDPSAGFPHSTKNQSNIGDDFEKKMSGLTLEESNNSLYDNQIPIPNMQSQNISQANQPNFQQFQNQANMIFPNNITPQPQQYMMGGSGAGGLQPSFSNPTMPSQNDLNQQQNIQNSNNKGKKNKKQSGNNTMIETIQQPPQMPPKPKQQNLSSTQSLPPAMQRYSSFPTGLQNQNPLQGQMGGGMPPYQFQQTQSTPVGHGQNSQMSQQFMGGQQMFPQMEGKNPQGNYANYQQQWNNSYNQGYMANQPGFQQNYGMYQMMPNMNPQYNQMMMQGYMQNQQFGQTPGQYPMPMTNPYYMNQQMQGGSGGMYPQNQFGNTMQNDKQMKGMQGRQPRDNKIKGQKSNQSRDGGSQGLTQTASQGSIQTIQQPKSEFLEELRGKIQNGKKIDIKDIKDHVVECAMDQYGSRFIQQKYDTTTPEEKELIFSEILPEANNLMNDVFGNYVVQKLFEYGTDQQRETLAEQLLGNILKLTKSMYGCRVVQKALEVISLNQQKLLISELKDAILDCIYDQNGNHVIQKCIEKMPSDAIDFIVQAVTDRVADLCVHTYGCRVIQRILEHCNDKQTRPILDQILAEIHVLTKDQFGNYVIQHVLENGKSQEDKNKIVKSIKGEVIELSNHKFASNVVEKCLQYGSEKDKKEIIDEFLDANFEDESGQQLNGALYAMMKDRYGNYVIQKCIEASKGKQRDVLIKKITACANVLKKQTNYSRHVYNFIEKMSSDGPGIPPQQQMSQPVNNNVDDNRNEQQQYKQMSNKRVTHVKNDNNVYMQGNYSTQYQQYDNLQVDYSQHVQRQPKKKL